MKEIVADKKYSAKLRKMRSVGESKEYLLRDGAEESPYLPDEVMVEWVKDFCNADDLVGVAPRDAWWLFNSFLYENELSDISSYRFYKIVRMAFSNITRKSVQIGKNKSVTVYAKLR